MKTILLLVAIVTIIYATATPATAIPGGWSNINITNPHIQELGKWAVLEENKSGIYNIKFQKVVSGDQQIVNGVNYRLIIDALRVDGLHGTYQAGLFEQDSTNPNTRKLKYFIPGN
jgi:hypothetical protein